MEENGPCMTDLSYRDSTNTCLLTPDQKPTTDQNTDTTKVQFYEPINITGLSYRNMCEGLLKGAEIAKTQV